MDEYFGAAVPRRLRVRSSVVVGQTRMPLRAFLIVVGFAVLLTLSLMAGTALRTAVLALLPLLIGTLVIVEGTWGGRSSRGLLRIGVRHILRPKHLRLQRPLVVVPLAVESETARTVRWLGHYRERPG